MNEKEYLVDLEEKFDKVKKLIEASVQDHETTPYYSKYAARQHLQTMNELLETITKKNEENKEQNVKIIGMLGAVQLQLAIIAMDTEELAMSEKHFNTCNQIISEHTTDIHVASVTLNLYNNMGLLWARRDSDDGLKYLTKAEEFYNKIKESQIVPIDYLDLFCTNYVVDPVTDMVKFEKAFTLTLYYLAQVYGPKNPLKSSVYCHQTMQRQLDNNDYDFIDWALNTATLSQFLMEKNGFKQARHHLSASLFMLEEHKKKLAEDRSDVEELEAKWETFRHRSADVARCWIKYCITLLTASKDRLFNTENIDETMSVCTDLSKMNLEDNCCVSNESFKDFEFKGIDLCTFEIQVSDQFVLTIEDAKDVMKCAQRHVAVAQEYYTLNTLASDYIEICQDLAQLYDILAFFEEDPDVRCKFFKRSIDILEKVQQEINPTYYLRYCQQIWARLGMLYSEILEIKLDRLKGSSKRPVQHTIAKINLLVVKVIANFEKFINSYRNASGGLPSRIVATDEKDFLQAYFHIAATQTRHITLDKKVQIENIEKSLKAYNEFMDYCKRNEKAEECVQAEMAVVKEMVTLLPLKIARLKNELPPPIQ